MQPPGDPDVVAGVKGLYAGLLEKVEFTILQLSNWNLLHPELIRYENQRVFDKLNDLAEAVEQQFTNSSGCSSTVIDNISHPSRPNQPNPSQGVAFATSPEPLLVNGRKETAHDPSCRVNDGSVVCGGDDEQGPGGCRQVTLGSEDAETLAIRQGKGTVQEKGSSEAMEMEQYYKMRWEPDPGSEEYGNTRQQEPSSPTPETDSGNSSNDDLLGGREESVRSAKYIDRRHLSATLPLSLSPSPFAAPPPPSPPPPSSSSSSSSSGRCCCCYCCCSCISCRCSNIITIKYTHKRYKQENEIEIRR